MFPGLRLGLSGQVPSRRGAQDATQGNRAISTPCTLNGWPDEWRLTPSMPGRPFMGGGHTLTQVCRPGQTSGHPLVLKICSNPRGFCVGWRLHSFGSLDRGRRRVQAPSRAGERG